MKLANQQYKRIEKQIKSTPGITVESYYIEGDENGTNPNSVGSISISLAIEGKGRYGIEKGKGHLLIDKVDDSYFTQSENIFIRQVDRGVLVDIVMKMEK